MLNIENNIYNDIEKLKDFRIHAYGNYVVITAKSQDKINNYTFLATSSILKHILCDMNRKIVVGSLSKCQFGNVLIALHNINCGFKLIFVNNELVLISKNKEKSSKNRIKVKKNEYY